MGRAKKRQWTSQAGECETDGCGEPAYCIGLCSACYAFAWYWTRKKTPAERRARQAKLALYETRMDEIAVSSRPRRVR